MLIPVLLFILGLILLIKGGDWFVDGAADIAHRFKVPELIIGATIVSIGTTLPEVMVSASAAVTGHPEIAYGNAIGSVICNTALISAITIAVRPGPVNRKSLKTPVIFFFCAAVFYCAVAYTTGFFSRLSGIILLGAFVAYMITLVIQGRKNPESVELEDSGDGDNAEPMWLSIIKLVGGAALIAVGADLLVDNGTLIAKALGVPEAVIALTFVALGTSLPELVTAISALVKGHSSLSLGNIIGANLFNIVLVSGMASALVPFSVPVERTVAGINSSLLVDIPVMFLVMGLMTVPALIRGKLSRWQGIVLLCIYAGFCVFQFAV